MRSSLIQNIAAGLLAIAASSVGAQVVINEVFENPPNGGDQTWEYIELLGPPGYDLSDTPSCSPRAVRGTTTIRT